MNIEPRKGFEAGRSTFKRTRGIRRRQGFGATRCCAQLGAYIRFCETNPPFCDDVFDATATAHGSCGGNLRNIRWVRFGKTNPNVGGRRGRFIEKWVRFRKTKPLGESRRYRPSHLHWTWLRPTRHAAYNGKPVCDRGLANANGRDARSTRNSEMNLDQAGVCSLRWLQEFVSQAGGFG